MALDGEVGYALIQTSARAIGQIYADVTVEESHRDESTITQHPVEGGAVIGDHVIDHPPTVEIRCGFSDSSAGRVGYVREQYQALLALKASKQPFNVYTGKRRYVNMLIRGLSVVTDPHSENVLMVSASLQAITIVSTQSSDQGTASPASDPANQADPASTGAVTNAGSQEVTGVGSQAFAGSFNPGTTGVEGGTVGNGSFGLGGINPSAETAIPPSGLDGLSPATSVTLPEISVTAPPETVGGLQGAGPDQYAIFGSAP